MEIKPRDRDMRSPVAEFVKGKEFKKKRREMIQVWNVYNQIDEIAQAEGVDFSEVAQGILESQRKILKSLRQIRADLQVPL